MANFPVMPFQFLPGQARIDPSPRDRLARNMVVVGEPPLSHEEYAIVTVMPPVPDLQKAMLLEDICEVIGRDLLASAIVYSIGIGLISFKSAAIRDRLIDGSPHRLNDDVSFSFVCHDEGINMRTPAFEREAWVMLLNFPLDYQTHHYIDRAVSCFGKLLLWHNPHVNKARVLVKVLINEVASVPCSLVIKQATIFGYLGRSWSVPVYLLNGHDPDPLVVGNEDPSPPLNASPHPYQLPFLTMAQQAQFDLQVWRQQNTNNSWDEAEQLEQIQHNGWGVWPPSPPIYRGVSLRAMTEYEGPSMMDGVQPKDNISDDLNDAWFECLIEIENAADRLINGQVERNLQFVCAGGLEFHIELPLSCALVCFFIEHVYRPSLLLLPHAPSAPVVDSVDALQISISIRGLFQQAMMHQVFTIDDHRSLFAFDPTMLNFSKRSWEIAFGVVLLGDSGNFNLLSATEDGNVYDGHDQMVGCDSVDVLGGPSWLGEYVSLLRDVGPDAGRDVFVPVQSLSLELAPKNISVEVQVKDSSSTSYSNMIFSGAEIHGHGSPRKVVMPIVECQVNRRTRRKVSNVPKATPPSTF